VAIHHRTAASRREYAASVERLLKKIAGGRKSAAPVVTIRSGVDLRRDAAMQSASRSRPTQNTVNRITINHRERYPMKFTQALVGLLLFFAIAAGPLCAAEKDIFDYKAYHAAPKSMKHIVFIATTGSHGSRGNHEFMAGSIYMARQLNADFPNAYAVVYSQDHWPKDLHDADAIIVLLNHGGPAAMDKNIKAAVERGAGFAAIHFGVEVNAGEQGKNYLDWMGGYFETFWSVNPFWKADIKPNADHPVTRGVKPFAIEDEWYYHMRFRDGMKGVTPLLTAVPPVNTVHFNGKATDRGGNADVLADVVAHKPQVLAWAYERPSGGRGFGFTGFHVFANLANDNFRTTLLNGVAWVAGLEIPAGGVASTSLSKADLDKLMDEAHKPGR
jgi:hypothetical protein